MSVYPRVHAEVTVLNFWGKSVPLQGLSWCSDPEWSPAVHDHGYATAYTPIRRWADRRTASSFILAHCSSLRTVSHHVAEEAEQHIEAPVSHHVTPAEDKEEHVDAPTVLGLCGAAVREGSFSGSLFGAVCWWQAERASTSSLQTSGAQRVTWRERAGREGGREGE